MVRVALYPTMRRGEHLFEFNSDLLSILQPTTMVSIIKQLARSPSKYRVSAKDLVACDRHWGRVRRALAFEAARVGGRRLANQVSAAFSPGL